jgi:uncharacterized protein (DUF2267 family)
MTDLLLQDPPASAANVLRDLPTLIREWWHNSQAHPGDDQWRFDLLHRVCHRLADRVDNDTARLEARIAELDAARQHMRDDRARRVMERLDALLIERYQEDGIDLRGWFVYCLFADDPTRPAYVGMSGNVAARLGQHYLNPNRGARITRVSLIRCRDAQHSRETEVRLIDRYQPPWNVAGIRPVREEPQP